MRIGVEVIKEFVKTSPANAGVYRMIGSAKEVLYIGKAKNLGKRLANYTNLNGLSERIRTMVSLTNEIEIIIADSEKEALLLEASLIKSLKPKFNILLKDDKSYPFILIRQDHEFGQILKHRGAKKYSGRYFGPFASIGDVNRSIEFLQKTFLLRSCSDSYFAARKRPCLQYQIKRCSAPCVGMISKEEYGKMTLQTMSFMEGKSKQVQQELSELMKKASSEMEFEQAALYRDRIIALNNIQARNSIVYQVQDCDVITIYIANGLCSIQVFFFRGGQNYGNRSYFPEQIEDLSKEEILSIFIADFYQHNEAPKQIYLNCNINEQKELQEIFKTKFYHPKTGDKAKLVEYALQNTKTALLTKLSTSAKQEKLFQATGSLFGLETPIHKIEVFDNSHISGKFALSAMIVATIEGFSKKNYRIFDIKSTNKEDDYAMLREALTRRYSRLIKETPRYIECVWPDLIIIDGGPGHLSTAKSVFSELKLDIPYICIAKGEKRNAGGETLHRVGRDPIVLPNDNDVMQFMQRLRDEAHRFVITRHRSKRSQGTLKSELEDIPGIGAERRRILLSHFG